MTSILGGGQPLGRTRLQSYFTHFSILIVPIHFLQFIIWSFVIAEWFASIIQGQWWFISHSIYLFHLAIIVFFVARQYDDYRKAVDWSGRDPHRIANLVRLLLHAHAHARTQTRSYVHVQKHSDQREMKEGLFEKESERTSIFPNMICWLDESTPSVLCCLLRKDWLNLAHLFHKQQKKRLEDALVHTFGGI